METIKLWLKGLTGFIFICAIFDAFIPPSPMKKTVKMVLGVIMSVMIVTPFIGAEPEKWDILQIEDEYINCDDSVKEMEELTVSQTKKMYESSVLQKVKEIAGEDAMAEVVFTEGGEIEKVVLNKQGGGMQFEIASAIGVSPSKIQMTE